MTEAIHINGYELRGPFLQKWLSLGDRSIEIFGVPISHERHMRLYDGTIVTVQYFRNVRLELHGDLVLISPLGQDRYKRDNIERAE